MRKSIVILLGMLILPLGLFAAERVVVLEIFTSTGCPPCVGAAMGAVDLVHEHPGEVLVVEYHISAYGDPFDHTNANARYNFYGDLVGGYPSAVFDGVDSIIGGYTDKSMIVWYNPAFYARRAVVAPLTIDLTEVPSMFQSTAGTVQAIITNVSNESVTGTVHFTVTESHIPHKWQILDSLDFVERDMLADASGEEITLAAGADITITRDYTIDDTWLHFTEDENIEFGCFVQSTEGTGALREIYQGAVHAFGDTATSAVQEPGDLPFSIEVPSVIEKYGFIELALDRALDVDVILFDALGRNVGLLRSGILPAGEHRIEIEARNLPTGAYFIKATCPGYSEIGKLLILH